MNIQCMLGMLGVRAPLVVSGAPGFSVYFLLFGRVDRVVRDESRD